MACRLTFEPMLEYLTLRNKLQWNRNRNSYISFRENAFGNVVWQMAAILSRPQCVKGVVFRACSQTSKAQKAFKSHVFRLCIDTFIIPFCRTSDILFAFINWYKLQSFRAIWNPVNIPVLQMQVYSAHFPRLYKVCLCRQVTFKQGMDWVGKCLKLNTCVQGAHIVVTII